MIQLFIEWSENKKEVAGLRRLAVVRHINGLDCLSVILESPCDFKLDLVMRGLWSLSLMWICLFVNVEVVFEISVRGLCFMRAFK